MKGRRGVAWSDTAMSGRRGFMASSPAGSVPAVVGSAQPELLLVVAVRQARAGGR